MLKITAFEKRWDRSGFRSGKPDLDDWLKRYVGQQERTNNVRTFLAVEDQRVVGYYALLTYRLDLDEAATAFGSGKRRYPVPAVLLARLAVDQGYQGRGYGKQLLVDALRRVADASRSIGFEILVVHAIDSDASTFYRRYGFTPFVDHDLHSFITLADLRATLDAADDAG